jgi:hypothetical protein
LLKLHVKTVKTLLKLKDDEYVQKFINDYQPLADGISLTKEINELSIAYFKDETLLNNKTLDILRNNKITTVSGLLKESKVSLFAREDFWHPEWIQVLCIINYLKNERKDLRMNS